jgi:ABC-type transport system substrate-binding protein
MKSTRTAVGALMLGGLIAAAGCPTATAEPPSTDTPPPPAIAPNDLALATLNDIVQGDPAAATVNFDKTMHRLLSPDSLQQAWTAYQKQLGPYLSQGDPQDTTRGEITVVNVPLQMQNAPGQFRLSVRSNGQIAGLYFLKDGVPVP